MDRLKLFFHQSWLYYKGAQAQFNLEELIFFRLSIPLLTLVYYCTIAGHSFNTDMLSSWVVGNAMLLCTNTCIFNLGGSFSGERYNGRLRWLVAAPHSRMATVCQKSLLFIAEGFLTAAMGLVFGSLIFGVSFAGVSIAKLALIVAAGMFASSCFGMFISVFGLVSDSMHLVLNLVNMAMLILCGANFPVASLPEPVQFVSRVLPFTRSIEAGQMLFKTFDAARFSMLLWQELLVGVVYLVLASVIFKVIERLAVKRALLEMF